MKDLSNGDKWNSMETLKVNTLSEISKALISSLDIKSVFNNVMDILSFCPAMNQGAITLLDPETEELIAEVFYGTDKQEIKEENAHKKVFESGLPVAISSFGGSPLFLDCPKSPDIRKPDISYLCVPMKIENRVIGALTVDRLFDDSVGFDQDLELMKNITSIIAQAVQFIQMVRQEKECLTKENERLCQELEIERARNAGEVDGLKTNPQKELSIEKVMEKKLDEIITVMDVKTEGKRKLYAEIISKVEKILIKLALKRTKNVKYEAAHFLGINRNTLHKKMKDLSFSA